MTEHEIINSLQDQQLADKARLSLVLELQRVGTDLSVPVLATSLRSSDVRICVGALHALSLIGTVKAMDAMIGSLSTIDSVAVNQAAHLVARSETRRAVPALASCLEDRYQQLGPTARRAILHALGRMPHRAAVPALTLGVRDRDRSTRKVAAWALGRVRAPESRLALEAAASELSFIRGRAARRALGAMTVE